MMSLEAPVENFIQGLSIESKERIISEEKVNDSSRNSLDCGESLQNLKFPFWNEPGHCNISADSSSRCSLIRPRFIGFHRTDDCRIHFLCKIIDVNSSRCT